MKPFFNIGVINIDCQANDHHGQYVEEPGPEGDQMVLHPMISLAPAPALSGLRPLNVVPLLAGLELNGDNIGVWVFCSPSSSVDHRRTWAPRWIHSVTFPDKYFPAAQNDSILPQEAVNNDTDFHGDGTGEEDEGDLFGKHLAALLL